MARRKWTHETIQQVLDNENPFIQSGYTAKIKKRKIGEEWTDLKGITWRKTSYGKVRVNNNADAIRELINKTNICSSCGADMKYRKNKLDEKVFSKTGKCYDCLEMEEMTLRVDAKKWSDYEEMKTLKNKLCILRDFRSKVEESIKFLKNDTGISGEVMPTGEVITWTGKANPQWLKDAEEDFIKANKEIEKLELEIDKIEKQK